MVIKERITELFEQKRFNEAHVLILDLNSADIAEILNEIPEEQMLYFYRILPKDISAEVFSELDSDMQEYIINFITDAEIQKLMDNLYMDDAVDLLEELPANVVKKIIKNTNPDRRNMINHFLNYPEDSAGTIMTIEFMDLNKEISVEQAIERIKRLGVKKETVNTCYVTNPEGILEGEITLKTLVLEENDKLIKDIMVPRDEMVYIPTNMDVEEVAYIFKKYDLQNISVVDNETRLVGIITVDDIFDIVESEDSEDFARMAAIVPNDDHYLKTSPFSMAKSRVLWLLILMITATFTQAIIKKYEMILAANVILAAYMPMLIDAGGNAGSQASAMVIRGMATGRLAPGDIFLILSKEFRISLIVGFFLALSNFVKMMIIDKPLDINVVFIVNISIILTIVISKLFGSVMPIIAKKIKIDPALISVPLITTVVDALTVIIYFSISIALLNV